MKRVASPTPGPPRKNGIKAKENYRKEKDASRIKTPENTRFSHLSPREDVHPVILPHHTVKVAASRGLSMQIADVDMDRNGVERCFSNLKCETTKWI